jgi:circadian clock protein KaiC
MPAKKKSVKKKVIRKVAKPKIKRVISEARVKSGINGLDPLIQGGFKPSSINLVEGGPGSGKTILATQFLYEGLKRGEPVAYITFEVMKEKFYENMKTFGWDLEKYEKKGLFTFLAYTPEQIKMILLEGGGTLDTIIHQKKIKRLVIDSITSFSLLYPSELAKKEAALTLFNVINSWSCTALLTAQGHGGKGEDELVSTALDFEVDGIMLLYHFIDKNSRKRGFEVLKMRGTKTPNKIFGVDIDKKGISIKKSSIQL